MFLAASETPPAKSGAEGRAGRGRGECSVEGCGGTVKGHGWCAKHYQRWRTHGDPLGGGRRHRTPEESFAANTERRGDCLIWTAHKNRKGYGRIGRFDGGNGSMSAHRYAWEREYGPIADGVVIDHRYHCDKACCEVTHLREATHVENARHRSGARSDSGTGVRNVQRTRSGKYVAVVWKEGVSYRAGSFASIDDAARAAGWLREVLFGKDFSGGA